MMKRKIFAAVMVLVFLFLAGSAYADFGGFSGRSSSRSSYRSRSRSSSSSHSSSSPGKGSDDSGKIMLILGGIFGCLGGPWLFRRYRILKYMKAHPDFDKDDIEGFAENIYFKMQDTWTAKDLTPIKDSMTEEFFNLMDSRLDVLRRSGRTDHTEQINVLSSSLYNIKQKDGTDIFTVRLVASIVSYITDDSTLKVVSGNRNRQIKMEYYIKFMDNKAGWVVCDMSGHRKKR